MRQAQESEIIRLSMDIREHKPIQYYRGTEVQVVPYEDVVTGMYTWADQILVATNNKRHQINDQMRQIYNLTGGPQLADKIICLENNWDIFDTSEKAPLINGMIGHITDCKVQKETYPINKKFSIGPITTYNVNFTNEVGESYNGIIVDKKYFDTNGEQRCLSPKQDFWIHRQYKPAPIQFDFGYAITVHRAQGSEWDKVLVCEEKFPFETEEHKRWLYTAVTRAASRLVLVR